MVTSATVTVTTMPILELRVSDKRASLVQEKGARYFADRSVPQMEKMACELNADIYGKGFFRY
jgi:hypothetical protein